MPAYVDVNQKVVDEFNSRTRFYCTEEFVSWKGEIRPCWFDPGNEPEDTWEKSPEGKEALEQEEKYAQMQAAHEQWLKQRERERARPLQDERDTVEPHS